MTITDLLPWPRILRAGVVAGVAFAALPAHAAKPTIGVAALVVKQVHGTSEQRTRQIALRDEVYQDEVVETGVASASELRFVDDTRITVGPSSKVILDRFVYDPDPGEGALVLRATEGVFRFFSGTMDSSNYVIQAPTVTAGVRGTIFVGAIRPSDGTFVLILESPDSGVVVTGHDGATVTLDAPGQAAVATPDGDVTKGSAPDWAAAMVDRMDGVIVAAADVAPPAAATPQAPPGRAPDTAASAGTAPEPGDDPPVTAPPLRGLPRALSNQDSDSVPDGLDRAVDEAGTRGVNDGEPGNGRDHDRGGGPGAGGSDAGNGGNGRGGGRGKDG